MMKEKNYEYKESDNVKRTIVLNKDLITNQINSSYEIELESRI
jgi:hypothetical protein